MSLSINGIFHKSDYQKALEAAIDTQLSSLSASDTSVDAEITALSGNITALNDFANVTVSTAVYTLDLTTYRNFTIDNLTTAAATLKISNAPTASDTMLDINLLLTFTSTASITYTGTVTWSQNTAPNPTAAGTFAILMKSFDAGSNWYASFTGLY
ncbi:MAG: hypothetical protein PHO15_00360 [Eubacteriales bacterium]|nr:hypothetical protein [Eubacteriales bacterium]